jgi:hypothetical protein
MTLIIILMLLFILPLPLGAIAIFYFWHTQDQLMQYIHPRHNMLSREGQWLLVLPLIGQLWMSCCAPLVQLALAREWLSRHLHDELAGTRAQKTAYMVVMGAFAACGLLCSTLALLAILTGWLNETWLEKCAMLFLVLFCLNWLLCHLHVIELKKLDRD